MLTDGQLRFLGDLCRYPGGIYASNPHDPDGHERPTTGEGVELAEMGLVDLVEKIDGFNRTHWVGRVNDLGRVTFKLLTGGRCFDQQGRVVFTASTSDQ